MAHAEGLGQCLAHVTAYASCYHPVIITAQLWSGQKNRWGCHKGGIVTHHF